MRREGEWAEFGEELAQPLLTSSACQSEPFVKGCVWCQGQGGKGKYIQAKECLKYLKEAFSTILLVLSTRRKVQKLKKQPQPLWRSVLWIQHSDIIASICWTKDFIVSQIKHVSPSLPALWCVQKWACKRAAWKLGKGGFLTSAFPNIWLKGFSDCLPGLLCNLQWLILFGQLGVRTDANHWSSFLTFIDKPLPSLLVFSMDSNWMVLPSIMVSVGCPNILDPQISSSRAIFCFSSLRPILDPSWASPKSW